MLKKYIYLGMAVKERIKAYAENIGITITDFEKSIYVSNGYVNSISKSIGIDKINLILEKYPNLNLIWLLTGKGEMLYPDIDKSPPIDEADNNLITIPIVDVAGAAGRGTINPDYPEQNGEIKLPSGMLSKRNGNYYCGLVRGDSMYPTLLDRDHIIFRLLHPGEWRDIQNGEVYFIIDRFGEAYVKRVINRLEKENRIICTSDNKEANIPDFNIMSDAISHIYYVEYRLSNNMSNLNDYNRRLKTIEENMEAMRIELKRLENKRDIHYT
jgi:hypothetical protein